MIGGGEESVFDYVRCIRTRLCLFWDHAPDDETDVYGFLCGVYPMDRSELFKCFH